MTDQPLDQWAYLNRFLDEIREGPGIWIPPADQRRLGSYRVQWAMVTNNLWSLLPMLDGRKAELGEWGEARLVVDRDAAGLVSDAIRFVVDGAKHPPPLAPQIPEPLPTPDPSDPVAVAAHAAAERYRAEEAATIIADWEQQKIDYEHAKKWQVFVDDWVKAEQVIMKLGEMEREFVGPLGDGIAVLNFDEELGRPTMEVRAPDEYFPDLDTDSRRWPDLISLAWESIRIENDAEKRRLHRVQYRTVPLSSPRTLPWNDKPTNQTVQLSEMWWDMDDVGKWDDLSRNRASVVIDDVDTELDFIPIVHVPNSASTVGHFGVSSIAPLVGILEAIAAHNADLAFATGLAGLPAFLATGVKVPSVAVERGAVLSVGKDETIKPLELGPALQPLMDSGDWLMERLALLSQIGNPMMGIIRGEASGTSGIKVRLQFGPYEQKQEPRRMVRGDKWSLMIKFAMRLAQFGNMDVPQGPPPPVSVAFGPVTPADTTAIVDQITDMLKAGSISTPTAIAELVAAGVYAVDSIEAEDSRIKSEDFDGAALLTEALGDIDMTAHYLGRQRPDAEPPEEDPPPFTP